MEYHLQVRLWRKKGDSENVVQAGVLIFTIFVIVINPFTFCTLFPALFLHLLFCYLSSNPSLIVVSDIFISMFSSCLVSPPLLCFTETQPCPLLAMNNVPNIGSPAVCVWVVFHAASMAMSPWDRIFPFDLT